MTNELHQIVVEALCFVAADLDASTVDPGADLLDDLGLDSMDSLNLVVAIKDRTGIEIPDREMPHLRTVTAIVAYLGERRN